MKTDKVTRVEIIEIGEGRTYVNMSCNNVELQLQDDNKTLKIFINEKS